MRHQVLMTINKARTRASRITPAGPISIGRSCASICLEPNTQVPSEEAKDLCIYVRGVVVIALLPLSRLPSERLN